jgi:hypothetical protein
MSELEKKFKKKPIRWLKKKKLEKTEHNRTKDVERAKKNYRSKIKISRR